MKMLTIDKSTYQKYKLQLLQLYIDSFSTGLSAQKIDPVVTGLYLDGLFEVGYGILITEKDELIGALLAAPLSIDALLPDKIRQNFPIENCVYIAEMMVKENARGKGLGKQLLQEFMQTVDKQRFKHAFIRVWVENVPAVTLYRKMGYDDYAFIDQVKTNPGKTDQAGNIGKTDTTDQSGMPGTFVMHKVYLYRKTD
jgi:GNAT superfamily N-acetyltransferase